MSLGSYDPDEEHSTATKRPAWQNPATPLAERALNSCRRKYFRGDRKHGSEFEEWDRLEQKAFGATEESYLFKRWIENCIVWATSMNAMHTVIGFSNLLHLIENDEKRIRTTTAMRTTWLKERRVVPGVDFKKQFEATE